MLIASVHFEGDLNLVFINFIFLKLTNNPRSARVSCNRLQQPIRSGNKNVLQSLVILKTSVRLPYSLLSSTTKIIFANILNHFLLLSSFLGSSDFFRLFLADFPDFRSL